MDKTKVRARLAELLTYEEGWDSYGGARISSQATDAASRLLDVLDHDPFVAPGSDGGLMLEWHRDGLELEVEIDPAGKIVYE